MVSGDALKGTGWMKILFSSKLICEMLSTLSPDRQYWMNVLHFSRAYAMGILVLWVPPHVMAPTLVRISSESGVQQGDPLGFLLFALVLHKLVASLEAEDECFAPD